MPRDFTFDQIVDTLIQRYVTVLSPLTGWGQLTNPAQAAVYPHLGLPMPQEPFPAAYIYLAGQQHDFSQGESIRRDLNQVNIRIIGGPITPGYKVNAESAVYKMITAVVNELDYRPYLQDPTNNDSPFRYIDPNGKLTVGQVGRIQGYNYGDQGGYI